MKTQHLFFFCFLGLLLLGGCRSDKNGKRSFPLIEKRASGMPYEVLLVMDKEAGAGEAGELLKEQLRMPVPGLPQLEPSMRVTFVEDNKFDSFLRYVRNILIVDIDATKYTKVAVNHYKDEWATGQEVIKLSAPSSEELVTYLLFHPSEIVDYFCRAEKTRRAAYLEEHYSPLAMKKAKEKFGLRIHAPEDMGSYKDTTDFLWVSNDANTGRIDLLVYSFPYTDANTFTAEYLIAKRDSVLKKNIPGSFPGSHMATETRFASTYEPITLNGKYRGVMRGLWKMVGDKMGGPFVSHTLLDEKQQRVIVAEGFVYAPETDKRNYIRKIEAALYTARLE